MPSRMLRASYDCGHRPLVKHQRFARSATHLPLILLLAVAAACSSPPPVTQPAGAAANTGAPRNVESRQVQNAELVIHVGKAGRLARLGHNHLMAASEFDSEAGFDQLGTLRMQVRLAVDNIRVDDPELRGRYAAADAAYAERYRSVPSAKNIADTRRNMRSAKVLDASNFPYLGATAIVPGAAAEFAAGQSGSLNVELDLQVRDQHTPRTCVLHWQRNASGLAGSCNFEVTHSELGLTPFSALGGALRVAERLQIELRGQLVHEAFRSGALVSDEMN